MDPTCNRTSWHNYDLVVILKDGRTFRAIVNAETRQSACRAIIAYHLNKGNVVSAIRDFEYVG